MKRVKIRIYKRLVRSDLVKLKLKLNQVELDVICVQCGQNDKKTRSDWYKTSHLEKNYDCVLLFST